jgi:hypothetical protein
MPIHIDDDIRLILDKQVLHISEVTGKQIQETYCVDHQLIFRFTDGTYAMFRIRIMYEGPDEIRLLSDFPDLLTLKKTGILSQEQFIRADNAIYGNKKRKTRADSEIATLRRLAEQYPEIIDELTEK